MLQPTPTQAVEAQVVPTRRFLLGKGSFIDCTLETAIDSTYDGMVTCIVANEVRGADGMVVLLEPGTKLVGEKKGEVKQGQGRVFVLWTEARTPTGVVARLDSPGTDELGRTGLPGFVDTHFWDRFGAAILISVIDGTLQAVASSQSGGGGTTVQLSPTGTRDVMTEILRSTVAIPPTVIKNQGDRIQVLVARDVDFRPVYALRTSEQN
jgi:type IV secretion system protein VirB10